MELDDARPRSSRGRVVMLVDNGVHGDSRVQKSARSVADAGWDVTLLGRSPDESTRVWRLGQAEVRLIPMPSPLAKRRHEFRRRWLLAPFAYPPNGIAEHRVQAVKAWRTDLEVRLADLDQTAERGGRRIALRAGLLAARLVGHWVSFRRWQLVSAQKVRRRLKTPWDLAYTYFWRAVQGDRSWRRLEPGLWDYELAFGKVIDELNADLIHAHDFRMLGVGARARIRARAQGRPLKLVWDAHEFVPGLSPWRDNARWLPAHSAYEREYARYADAVVTVSEALAELLQERHGLAVRPAVALNAPAVDHAPSVEDATTPGIRQLCGIDSEVPLVVYSGLAAKKRGLGVMIEALPLLAGVHVALVVNQPGAPYVRELLSRAAELGVADRVHALPYVPHDQVARFLAAADVGVIPIHHYPNHEIALITKFFEYAHARLPIVVSDVRTMADTVHATGQGEVFRAEDAADYARAVSAVLAEPKRYRAAYERPGLLAGWTWEAQAEIVEDVYRSLLPDRVAHQASTIG